MQGDKQRGIYGKYYVQRVDENGQPKAGHENRQYYVLDIFNDPFAVDALQAYANACHDEYPALANDLRMLALEARTARLDKQLHDLKEEFIDGNS